VVVGGRSLQFWRTVTEARQAIADAVIADQGHSRTDAPKALMLLADSVAQSALLQASAFDRLCEAGGPMTSPGPTPRACAAGATAPDRLKHHLRLVGLRRLMKPVDPLEALQRAVADAQEPQR
jgi:hypothetical protein